MVSGSGAGREKTMPTLRRSSITSIDGSRIFCPLNRIDPSALVTSARSFRRFNARRSVDFPPPAGPKKTLTAFSITSMLTSFRLSTPSEYIRVRFLTAIFTLILASPLTADARPVANQRGDQVHAEDEDQQHKHRAVLDLYRHARHRGRDDKNVIRQRHGSIQRRV